MKNLAPSKPGSRLLARMMDLDLERKHDWTVDDLTAMLRHQFQAPLKVDLASLGPKAITTLTTIQSAQKNAPTTFGELLHHPTPSVELLTLCKDFAKASIAEVESGLPKEIGTVLYYASIVVALVRCGQRITKLDNKSLRRGLGWSVGKPWVDDATRSLLLEGMKHLSKS